MDGIQPEAFEFAMHQIKDGFVFEKFAQDLLCQIVGKNFIPMGGLIDRGIDGLEHCFTPEGIERTVYQLSIDKDPSSKVDRTLIKLRDNEIDCGRLVYVTTEPSLAKETRTTTGVEFRRDG